MPSLWTVLLIAGGAAIVVILLTRFFREQEIRARHEAAVERQHRVDSEETPDH